VEPYLGKLKGDPTMAKAKCKKMSGKTKASTSKGAEAKAAKLANEAKQ